MGSFSVVSRAPSPEAGIAACAIVSTLSRSLILALHVSLETVPAESFRRDVRIIGLVGIAHAFSHFFQLALAAVVSAVARGVRRVVDPAGPARRRVLRRKRRHAIRRGLRRRPRRRAAGAADGPGPARRRHDSRVARARRLLAVSGRGADGRGQRRVPSGRFRDPERQRRAAALGLRLFDARHRRQPGLRAVADRELRAWRRSYDWRVALAVHGHDGRRRARRAGEQRTAADVASRARRARGTRCAARCSCSCSRRSCCASVISSCRPRLRWACRRSCRRRSMPASTCRWCWRRRRSPPTCWAARRASWRAAILATRTQRHDRVAAAGLLAGAALLALVAHRMGAHARCSFRCS